MFAVSTPVDFLDPGWPAVRAPATTPEPERLLGGPVLERADLARRASPLSYITDAAPPFFLIHGGRDETVPISQAELLYRALADKGADVTLMRIARGAHDLSPYWEEVRQMMLVFFTKYLME